MRTPNEYFLMDGDDLFAEVTTAWGDDNFHRVDAKVTIVAITWAGSGTPIFSNCRCSTAGITTPDVVFNRQASTKQTWFQEGDTNAGYPTTMVGSYLQNNWSFAAISIDANAGSSDITHVADLIVEPYPDETENYGSGNAESPATIGGVPGGSRAPIGTRFAIVLLWTRALSTAELGSLYGVLKAERFTTLP